MMRILKKIWNNQTLCGYGGLGVVLLGVFGLVLSKLPIPIDIIIIGMGMVFIIRGVWYPTRSV